MTFLEWLRELEHHLGRHILEQEEFQAHRLHKQGIPPTWAASLIPPPIVAHIDDDQLETVRFEQQGREARRIP